MQLAWEAEKTTEDRNKGTPMDSETAVTVEEEASMDYLKKLPETGLQLLSNETRKIRIGGAPNGTQNALRLSQVPLPVTQPN
jgi:hypothetical protein